MDMRVEKWRSQHRHGGRTHPPTDRSANLKKFTWSVQRLLVSCRQTIPIGRELRVWASISNFPIPRKVSTFHECRTIRRCGVAKVWRREGGRESRSCWMNLRKKKVWEVQPGEILQGPVDRICCWKLTCTLFGGAVLSQGEVHSTADIRAPLAVFPPWFASRVLIGGYPTSTHQFWRKFWWIRCPPDALRDSWPLALTTGWRAYRWYWENCLWGEKPWSPGKPLAAPAAPMQAALWDWSCQALYKRYIFWLLCGNTRVKGDAYKFGNGEPSCHSGEGPARIEIWWAG